MDLTNWDKIAPVLSVLSPIIVILLSGLWFNSSLEKLKSRLQANQAIVQKRAEIYAEIQEPLNGIYCYIKRVGKWKKLTPKDVIDSKRKVDQKMHSTRPFWSNEMQLAYKEFMDACFVTNRGHKANAGIVAEVIKYQELDSWKDEFNEYFEGNFVESKLDQANDKLMKAFSKDFGVD
ncbi:hypothetical protein [Photobacterium kishitanii]|uniref:Uncharacterized protein n=1 Tax=Photobacterium kishitanii TaxID=318456 RepID=A0A2T3KJU2_9GAMM|nr:hypothetical protein [Photobacterium kishitanii]PSU99762.1 hypothetical protein C9J27_09045 [Photobacterium kishitanii]